jgi:succinate dehydrogenase/fumarate reductase flavoprotein subunit
MPAPGLHVIFGSGGILVNSKGERFMEKYNPELLEESRRFDTARAILLEWKEGRGPCYLDCTHLSSEAIGTIMTSLPLFASGLKALGLDLKKDKVEYVPYGLNIQHQAGVRVNNADGDVGVQGLRVVGTAGDFCGGVDGTIASSLIGSAVQGAKAGERAVEDILYVQSPVIDMAQVWALRENIYEPLETDSRSTIETHEAKRRLWEIMMRYVNLVKNEAMLKKAVAEISKLLESFKKGSAKDIHELARVHELRNMLTISELIAKSAIIRTESRRCHYRLDYPNRDDKTWLKWIITKLVNGKAEIWTEDIPISKWKHKPAIGRGEEKAHGDKS